MTIQILQSTGIGAQVNRLQGDVKEQAQALVSRWKQQVGDNTAGACLWAALQTASGVAHRGAPPAVATAVERACSEGVCGVLGILMQLTRASSQVALQKRRPALRGVPRLATIEETGNEGEQEEEEEEVEGEEHEEGKERASTVGHAASGQYSPSPTSQAQQRARAIPKRQAAAAAMMAQAMGGALAGVSPKVRPRT